MSKDSLIKGTLILTFAAFIARFLGLVQRVPLQHMLNESGMATYTISYNIYFILLTIATAGIPSALSKMISERAALGQKEETTQIFRAAVRFSLWAGAVMTVVLLAVAPWYAEMAGNEEASYAIQALAPALLMFPLIAMMRGYFLGRHSSMPNGLSQIWEQILRVITAVGLAYFIGWLGYSQKWMAAGASFGGVTGGAAALAVMAFYYRKMKARDRAEEDEGNRPAGPAAEALAASKAVHADGSKRLTQREIYRMIFTLSIPITVISITVQLIYFIDSSLTIPLLKGAEGVKKATDYLGVLGGRAQSVAGIPPIVAIAISQSILPLISAAYARKDAEGVRNYASKALRLCILLSLPLVIIMSTAASPVNRMLFSNEELRIPVADTDMIIILLTAGTFFQILMMLSGSILTGLGEMRKPMAHVAMGIGVKLAGTVLLSMWLGIYGIIIATTLCFITIMSQNLLYLRSKVDYRIFGGKWINLGLAALLLIGAGIGLERFGSRFIQVAGERIDSGITCVLIGTVLLALYPLLLMAFKVVTAEDVQAFPAPLRKLLARGARLIGRKPVREGA